MSALVLCNAIQPWQPPLTKLLQLNKLLNLLMSKQAILDCANTSSLFLLVEPENLNKL